MALSLPQAVRYAVQNKSSLLATRLAEQTAAARVGEIKAQGLPQAERRRPTWPTTSSCKRAW
ncbi:MAG: hypothetical protein WKG07_14785 [Hymenobacter sp.]